MYLRVRTDEILQNSYSVWTEFGPNFGLGNYGNKIMSEFIYNSEFEEII
jgi:hypothetical protein